MLGCVLWIKKIIKLLCMCNILMKKVNIFKMNEYNKYILVFNYI